MAPSRVFFHLFVTLSLFLRPLQKPTILLIGFEPFGKRNINISDKLIQDLKKEKNFDSLILPVSFNKVEEILNKKLESSTYNVILMLGEHKSSSIRVDIAAQNYYKDTFDEGSIDLSGPYLLFSPFAENLLEIHGLNFSSNAGKYVCNYVYYKALKKKTLALFVHVPNFTLSEYMQQKHHLISTLHQILTYTSKVK